MESNFATQTINTSDKTVSSSALRVELTALPVINYAMQHNGVDAIQSITIENLTDRNIENADIHITSLPGFVLPFSRHVDLLPAKKTVTITRPKLILNADYLAGVTERVTGSLHMEVSAETALASVDVQTTVLAFDEWQGLPVYPELLAAFVTPNHPGIGQILARATGFLGEWTGDTALDGYQSQNPNRILSQAAAIFAAIKEQAIAYAVPPASFEQVGQRVRLCDMVLGQKLGTCLDLTLLYAACLEAAGLHPILIATTGHIFTGVWLEEKMFPETVQDDVSLITKRLASGVNEIAVAETTCVTTSADLSFDDARLKGEQNLTTQALECIIDIHRARLSQIRPLPLRVATPDGWVVDHGSDYQPRDPSAPRQLDDTIQFDPNAKDDVLPKIAQWERKLLDLGLRNTLINLRLTKTQVPILTDSLDALENALSDGSDFSILPRPEDWKSEQFSFESLPTLGTSPIIQAEFKCNRLRTILTDTELAGSIKELYRAAKSALEENGANTLYLSLGTLRWFENKRSTKARFAPIVLLPIEIVRKSALQGYVIRLRDEDSQMNITLLEKLKQDFGIIVKGLDPLPMDEHGIDLRRVLTVIRMAVMDQPHWDVLETASIGIFSFSQFVMWNDLRNRTEDLRRNKVVNSLIEGRLSWDAQPLELSRQVDEGNVLLPMSADASQLHAIEASCSGKSFVLHGPPGTGKSQTITSLIANALAQGKRVLFVAEKMAALEVVQKRLDSIGIGPFCLELHSNKSKKKAVLEQLRQATEVTKTTTPKEYAAKARQIAALRSELDQYARQLHTCLPCGSDLHALIDEYEAYRSATELTPFSPDYLRSLDSAALEQHQFTIERLVSAGHEVGHPSGHPLSAVGRTQYSQSLRSSLKGVIDAYKAQLNNLSEPLIWLSQHLGMAAPASFSDVEQLFEIARQMSLWFSIPSGMAAAGSNAQYYDELRRLIGHSENANALEQQLLQTFNAEFLTLSGDELMAQYIEIDAKWFLPKALDMGKLRKKLNHFAKVPIEKDDIYDHIHTLQSFQQESRLAAPLLQKFSGDLGPFYTGKATDWTAVARLANTARSGAQTLHRLTGSDDLLRQHCCKPEYRSAVDGVCQGYAPFAQAREAFCTLLEIRETDGPNWLQRQLTLCQTISDHSDELKEWIAYSAAAADTRATGLGNLADSFEAGLAHEELFPAYKKTMLCGLICDAIDSSDSLTQFSGAVFNKKIDQYKRLDAQLTQLSRQEIYCRLAAKVPDFTREAAHSSELGILQRCIKSGGRGVSIRKLFDQIPNLLSRLCPCMLMSPISVAQYLDPNQVPFDIVVFDEASQLPTCKAVGVLARGADAIIVGDPKQMPPTSFFTTNTVDEDNLDVEDLESILDDCLALNMPQAHLLWHYRSRHESLIAFSNCRFYENKLFTFPSVNDRESKVRLVPVNGVFERGKGRKNQAEAEAIVEELKRRCHDPALAGQSVGVVTFNISQQNLIDDLLNDACAKDPELEKWAYGSEEPVFIKNLENVQGDERDVILFSIGYGPDEKGKVYMNFGPLNRDGGWRRLNVAVSRARREMVVFSTLKPEQIDLNRTQSEGVAALRAFLEYAQGNPLALDESTVKSAPQTREGIAAEICAALKERGFDTDLSVGRSAYRIDIGVVDPRQPDRYLLGILLDGDSYGSARTTRDREIAQLSVLNGLGWNLLRVWSMDWWDNREKELSRILAKVESLQKAPAKSPEAASSPSEETTVSAAPKLQSNSAATTPVIAIPAEAPAYQSAILSITNIPAEDFTEPRYGSDIKKRIRQVIDTEAPISESLLVKRVVQSCGISRAGSRISGYLDEFLEKMKLTTSAQDGDTFYWRKGQDPDAYAGFRVSGEGDSHRDVRDVPMQEVANAICVVLHEQVSMAQEDLLREAARKLGYARLGGNVQTTLEAGIQYAQTRGRITLSSNGTFVLSPMGTARAEASLQAFRKEKG